MAVTPPARRPCTGCFRWSTSGSTRQTRTILDVGMRRTRALTFEYNEECVIHKETVYNLS
jgi:hypothetical protein